MTQLNLLGSLPFFDHTEFSPARKYYYIGSPHQHYIRDGKVYSRLMSTKLIEKSSDHNNPCRVRFFGHFLNMMRTEAQFSLLIRSEKPENTHLRTKNKPSLFFCLFHLFKKHCNFYSLPVLLFSSKQLTENKHLQ